MITTHTRLFNLKIILIRHVKRNAQYAPFGSDPRATSAPVDCQSSSSPLCDEFGFATHCDNIAVVLLASSICRVYCRAWACVNYARKIQRIMLMRICMYMRYRCLCIYQTRALSAVAAMCVCVCLGAYVHK